MKNVRDPNPHARTCDGLAALGLTLVALAVSACGGGSEAAPTTPPPGGGGTSSPAPIVAPAATWTFVPIEGARCANGSATGIGVRLVPGSRELFIYMEGGGACSSGDSCWGNGPGGAANLNGYSATQFAAEDKLTNFAFLDGSTGTRNPFARMNMVMVPYCTGDVHGGTRMRALAVGNTSRDTYFVGATNLQLALERLAVTLPTLDAVWLMGTSAGGGGATLHYSAIRSRLRATVHTLVDSSPGFAAADDAQKWDLWGLQTPCAGCTTPGDVRRFNRSLDPASRYGFLTFRYDATTSQPGWTEARYDAEMTTVVTEIQRDVNARTFVVDNSNTGFTTTLHVVTTKNNGALRNAYTDWVTAMVDNTGWNNRTLVVP